jgi:hypothetical protein
LILIFTCEESLLLFPEIDLRTERIIDGFASQGFSDAMKKRWVTAYLVHYSLDGVSWAVISMREQERVRR